MRNKAIPNIEPEAMESVRKNIAEIRKKKGLTQTELGNGIGVSQRVISYYENEAPNIALDALTAIAKALTISVNRLLDRNDTSDESLPLPRAIRKRISKISNLSPKG